MVTAAPVPTAVAGKGGKDKIFTSQTQSTTSAPLKKEPVVVDLQNDEDEELEDQENVKPFAASAAPPPSQATTILKENVAKTIPTTTAPSTPSHPTTSATSSTPLSTNSYEPSPQPHSASASATVVSTVSNSPPQPQYQIDDRDDSGSDTGDESDNDQQSVPDWAKQPKLRQALERQYGLIPGVPAVDPDTLFPDVQTCVLEEIFGRKEGKCGK